MEKTDESADTQPGIETFSTAASKEKDARKISITYIFGKDLEEAVELHGAEVVYGMFVKSLKIAIQANVRRMLEEMKEDGSAKYDDEAIQNFVQNEYKPGVRAARATGEKGIASLVSKIKKAGITLDQLKALLESQA
jgi:hypothetical protein